MWQCIANSAAASAGDSRQQTHPQHHHPHHPHHSGGNGGGGSGGSGSTGGGGGFRPLPRSGAVMGFLPQRGSLVLYGGNASSSGENFLDDTFLYDVDGQCFRPVHPNGVPFAMDRHTGVEYDGKLWVFGGDRGWVLSNKLWVFDPAMTTWTSVKTPNPPVPRRGHTAVRCLHRKSMIVYGGIIMLHQRSTQPPSTLLSISETYELPLEPPHVWHKHVSRGEMPPKRRGHVAVTVEPTEEWPETRMYVFGGYCELPPERPGGPEIGAWMNDLWRFVPETSEWCEVPCWGDVPPPTVGHCAAVTPKNTLVMFAGGTRDNVLTNAVYECKENGFWRLVEPTGPSPPPRSYCCGAWHGNQWFVFGGCDNDGELSDLHALDLRLGHARPRSLLNLVAEYVIEQNLPYYAGTPRATSPCFSEENGLSLSHAEGLGMEDDDDFSPLPPLQRRKSGSNRRSGGGGGRGVLDDEGSWVVCFEGGTTMSLRDFEAVSGIAVSPKAVLMKQPTPTYAPNQQQQQHTGSSSYSTPPSSPSPHHHQAHHAHHAPSVASHPHPLLATPPPAAAAAHPTPAFAHLPNGDIRVGLHSADPTQDTALYLTLKELAECSAVNMEDDDELM